MKPYLLTALACATVLAAVWLHEYRADRRMQKLGSQVGLGLNGVGWSIRP